MTRVNRFNNRRLLEPVGNIPPAEAEERYYVTIEEPAMACRPRLLWRGFSHARLRGTNRSPYKVGAAFKFAVHRLARLEPDRSFCCGLTKG